MTASIVPKTFAEAAHLYGWEIATYKPQSLLHYQGNLCIEALEDSLSPLEVKSVIEYLPMVYSNSLRMKDNERLQVLMSLTNFMLPLTSHVQMPVAVDAMMRQGYVGRTPRSPQHIRIFHRVAEHAHGKDFRQSHDTVCAQSSAALVGVSGMGKTSTLKRFLARQKQVIYHPDIDVAQVTWIHVKMVTATPGIKGLCARIIKALDDLFAFKDYYKTFVGNLDRATTSGLIHAAGFLLNAHLVGLLIVDELQNLHSTKSDNSVMNELASLCDETEVPILFVTTPKGKKILTEAARQMRRSIDLGFGNWDRLPKYDIGLDGNGHRVELDGEWVDLVRELWKHCVLRNRRPLDKQMLDVLYECTQGNIDLTIKLFILCEWTAILSDDEEMSEALVRHVYSNYMTIVHPLIEAYKRNDIAALLKLEDVLPLDLKETIGNVTAEYRTRSYPAVTTRPGQAAFLERLSQALTALGLPGEEAAALAKRVQDEGHAKDMFAAVARATELVTPKRRKKVQGAVHAAKTAHVKMPDLSSRPADLRNAFLAATAKGTHVVDELVNLGIVERSIEELLCLD